jgi:hypothetical protein
MGVISTPPRPAARSVSNSAVRPASSTALPSHHHRVHGRVSCVTGGQSTASGVSGCPDTTSASPASAANLWNIGNILWNLESRIQNPEFRRPRRGRTLSVLDKMSRLCRQHSKRGSSRSHVGRWTSIEDSDDWACDRRWAASAHSDGSRVTRLSMPSARSGLWQTDLLDAERSRPPAAAYANCAPFGSRSPSTLDLP